MLIKYSFGYIFLFLLLVSCMSRPIQRRSSSYIHHSQNRPQNQFDLFSPIKKKVVLLPFVNEALMGKKDLAITATEEFRKEVSKMRDYVIDTDNQSLFGTSKEVYSAAGVNLVQMARKAKLSGVNLVIYGRIINARVRQKADEIGIVRKTKSFAQSLVEIRVFDVHANKEIFSEKMNGNISDSSHKFFLSQRDETLSYRRNLLRYSVRVAVRKFLKKINTLGGRLDWTGRVAKIIGSKIYVNAGRKSGLSVGDILKVVTEGSEVFDPQSGSLIGISRGEVKGTLEVIDYFGPDGTVAILHSGGSVTEGDFVQLY